MAEFLGVFRGEVVRLARKVVRTDTQVVRKQSARHRSDIAELKRQVADLNRRLEFLENREKVRLEKQPTETLAENARFSPRWVKSQRERLGLSAHDFARLIGVSAPSVYNWEHGRSKPRKSQLAALVSVRDVGKREAKRRLEVLGE